jgi:hypothetical protein
MWRAKMPLRGFENVRAEWAIVCTVHNVLKLTQCVRSAVASEVATNEARQKTSRLYHSTIDLVLKIPTAIYLDRLLASEYSFLP